jgi:hypothetical protein
MKSCLCIRVKEMTANIPIGTVMLEARPNDLFPPSLELSNDGLLRLLAVAGMTPPGQRG